MEEIKKYTAAGKQLEIVRIGQNGQKERYDSSFLKTEEGYYLISPPRYGDRIFAMKSGEKISLYLYTPEGIYNLRCSVLECYEKYYKISLPHDVQRAQRREYVRVNMRIPMQLVIEGNSGTRFCEIVTKDISARGAGFYTNAQIARNEKISVKFSIAGKTIRTYAALIYCKERKGRSAGGPRFAVALNFTSVTQPDIDHIVKECFAFQSKTRRLILDNEEE